MSALGLLTQFGLTKPAGGGGPTFTLVDGIATPTKVSGNFNHIGWVFTLASPASVTGLRYFGAVDGVTETLNLWEHTSGALLGSVPIVSTTNAWVQATLSVPVPLAANTEYMVSAHPSAIHDYYQSSASGSSFHPGVTWVAGRYGSGPSMPATDWAGRLLGIVDAVLQ